MNLSGSAPLKNGVMRQELLPFQRVTSAALVVSLMLAVGTVLPVRAQPVADGAPAGAVCMAMMEDDRPVLAIILPATDAAAMKAKGYQPRSCSESFATQAQREAWRDRICELAALPLENIQKQFHSSYGERAQVLCGMAEVATSQWRKGREAAR